MKLNFKYTKNDRLVTNSFMARDMRNNKLKYVWLTCFTLILSFGCITQMSSAHSPKFIDLKFYLDDQILSIYYVHGVSNTSYHFIQTVEIEFFNISTEFFDTLDKPIDKIVEADVLEMYLIELVVFNATYTEQHDDTADTQDTLIVHDNITVTDYIPTLNVTYWTYIRVTAYCNLGGNFTQNALAGQIWYDIEHSMIEAVVPTLVCAVVILTPLVIWVIIGKQKQKREITQEVTQ